MYNLIYSSTERISGVWRVFNALILAKPLVLQFININNSTGLL